MVSGPICSIVLAFPTCTATNNDVKPKPKRENHVLIIHCIFWMDYAFGGLTTFVCHFVIVPLLSCDESVASVIRIGLVTVICMFCTFRLGGKLVPEESRSVRMSSLSRQRRRSSNKAQTVPLETGKVAGGLVQVITGSCLPDSGFVSDPVSPPES